MSVVETIDIAELRKESLIMLRDVKAVLDEGGVRYWLDLGSLLGAVRDGRTIPWDDDFDLSMLDPDITERNDLWEKLRSKGYEVLVDFRVDASDHVKIMNLGGGIGNCRVDLHKLCIKNGEVEFLGGAKYTRIGEFFRRLNFASNFSIPRLYSKKPVHTTLGAICRSILSTGVGAKELEGLGPIEIREGPCNAFNDFTLHHSRFSVVSNPFKGEESKKFALLGKVLSVFPVKLLQICERLTGKIANASKKGPELEVITSAEFYENLGTAELHGMTFNTPSPAEDYLTLIYGADWHTPKVKWETLEDSPFSSKKGSAEKGN